MVQSSATSAIMASVLGVEAASGIGIPLAVAQAAIIAGRYIANRNRNREEFKLDPVQQPARIQNNSQQPPIIGQNPRINEEPDLPSDEEMQEFEQQRNIQIASRENQNLEHNRIHRAQNQEQLIPQNIQEIVDNYRNDIRMIDNEYEFENRAQQPRRQPIPLPANHNNRGGGFPDDEPGDGSSSSDDDEQMPRDENPGGRNPYQDIKDLIHYLSEADELRKIISEKKQQKEQDQDQTQDDTMFDMDTNISENPSDYDYESSISKVSDALIKSLEKISAQSNLTSQQMVAELKRINENLRKFKVDPNLIFSSEVVTF